MNLNPILIGISLGIVWVGAVVLMAIGEDWVIRVVAGALFIAVVVVVITYAGI